MESVIVLTILAVVVGAAGWSFYRTVTGKKGWSCSNNCNACGSAQLIANSKIRNKFFCTKS